MPLHQRLNVGRHDILNGRIAAPDDVARFNHVINGDVVLFKEVLLLIKTLGHFIMEDVGQQPPEVILRMTIVKLLLPALDRREGTEKQVFGFRWYEWAEAVTERLIGSDNLPPVR